MNGLLGRISRDQQGLTGLSVAIILIAFVIVAAVFAYVVLSAGLFSSQEVKAAVNTGLESTMGTIEPRGDVIGRMEDNVLKDVYIFLGVPATGSPVDFTPAASGNTSRLIISYHDADNMVPSVNWTVERVTTINGDYLLDPNELFMVTVDLAASTNATIGPYHTFTLEIKPADGPAAPVERTVPSRISQYVNLR